jgi:hypothetical protein
MNYRSFAITTHPGAMEAHPVTVEAHPGAVEAYLVTVEAHPGAVEAHPVTEEAHPGAIEAHSESTSLGRRVSILSIRGSPRNSQSSPWSSGGSPHYRQWRPLPGAVEARHGAVNASQVSGSHPEAF